jgi:multiple sugar transport system permease protein
MSAGVARSRHRFRPLWLLPVLITMLFPLFWMFFLSFQPAAGGVLSLEAFRRAGFTLANYASLFREAAFARYIFNSVFVAAVVVAANVFTAAAVGYALARSRHWGSRLLTVAMVATLMLPKQVLMIPLYLVCARLGILDTYWALILPFAVDAFSIFLVRQYVLGLPAELEDAARVDGASEFRIFGTIVLPLMKPVLAVVAINAFLINWNSFLYPLIFVDSDALRTLPVGLALFAQGEHSVNWGLLMAGSGISALPTIAVFLFFQRQILEGIVAGAEK